MAPQRRRQPSWVLPAVCCVAAVAVTVCRGSFAFTAGAAPSTVTERQVNNVASRASVSIGRESFKASAASESSWQLAGFAAFAVVSAAQALRLRQNQSRKSARCIVACRAVATPFVAPRQIAPVSIPVVEAIEQPAGPALISFAAEPVPSAVPAKALRESATPFIAPAARRPSPARCIGGSRRAGVRSSSRSASRMARRAASDEKSSNRQTGARLQAHLDHQVMSPSYDASRVRSKIQLGLRYKTRGRSASSRESKTPSTSSDTTKSSRVCLQMSGFASVNDAHVLFQYLPS